MAIGSPGGNGWSHNVSLLPVPSPIAPWIARVGRGSLAGTIRIGPYRWFRTRRGDSLTTR